MAAFSLSFPLFSILFLSLAFWSSVTNASTSSSSSRIPSPFVENPLNPQYFTSSSSSIKTEQQHAHPTLSDGCHTSLIAWKNMSYPQQITMQVYSGHSFDDLGLFDACQLLPLAHHCTITFPIAGIPSSMGLCIPKSCTQEDMLLELSTLMGLPLGLIYDGLRISGIAGNETIAACADQQTRWYEDNGATGMVVLVIILASIVAITTVADHMLTIRKFSMKQAHIRVSHIYPSNATYVALPNFTAATIQHESNSNHHPTEHLPSWHRFIQSFSAIRSIRSLLAPIPTSDIDMSCLNGIRVLSIIWIIIAHTMLFHGELFRDPIYLLTSVVKRVSIQVVLEAFFAVDSFFFLTSFLSAYLLLQQLSHTHSKLSLLLCGYYIHRYLRLTLIYFFWLCMYWKLMRYIGAGQSPTQYQLQGYVTLNKEGDLIQFIKEESCDKYWWTNLLYINNFYPAHYADVCIYWSWYMANEMQFAILLPFLVLLYHRSRIAGLTLIITLLITSFTYVGIISHQYGFTTNMLHQQFNLDPQMNHDYQNLLYNKPWARMQPWLIGILYAYLLHARPQRIPTRVYWPCMIVAAFLMAGLVFGPAQLYQEGGNENWSRTTHDLYMATSRGMWAVGLGYLCYSMIVGTGEEPLLDASGTKEAQPGSYVTSLLSHPIWTPLARLSYQAYLVHSTWIIIFVHQYRSKPYYTDLMYVYWIIGNIIMAFVLAAVGYVLVEKPLTNLTNWVMRGKGEAHSADHHH